MESESYVFYDETTSMCEDDDCLKLVPTKIIIENNSVFYVKNCLIHGHQKTLISTDVNYFKQSRDIINFSNKPSFYDKGIEKGCPYDCGLCSEHEQKTAMAIVEIIDECNLGCPTCIANSHIGSGNAKPVGQVIEMFKTLINNDSSPDLVMISGGEPTVHPQLLDIIRIAYEMPFKRVMLITNGVEIAENINLVEKLSQYNDKLEIYLQFDSLDSEVLLNIRGRDLRDIRMKSVENLEKFHLHSTLICVVKKSLNDHDMSSVINFGLQYSYIRGVTFQPCKITGRNNSFSKEKDYITLSEVRTNILNTFPEISDNDFLPHPLNPENISIAYLLKQGGKIIPFTNYLFYSQSSGHKYKFPFPYSEQFKKQMYFLPTLNTEMVKYENLFRVTIVSFLDKFNFCTTSVKRSCIHFVTTDQQIIPLDTYYLLYN